MKTRSRPEAPPDVRPPPIDIRFRTCQHCGLRKPTKGGSIRVGRGASGGHFLCADCKPERTR